MLCGLGEKRKWGGKSDPPTGRRGHRGYVFKRKAINLSGYEREQIQGAKPCTDLRVRLRVTHKFPPPAIFSPLFFCLDLLKLSAPLTLPLEGEGRERVISPALPRCVLGGECLSLFHALTSMRSCPPWRIVRLSFLLTRSILLVWGEKSFSTRSPLRRNGDRTRPCAGHFPDG